jgi:hypothetical protein
MPDLGNAVSSFAGTDDTTSSLASSLITSWGNTDFSDSYVTFNPVIVSQGPPTDPDGTLRASTLGSLYPILNPPPPTRASAVGKITL